MEEPVCRDSWGCGPMGQPQAGDRLGTLGGMTESVNAAACVEPFQASLAWDGEAAMARDGEEATAWRRGSHGAGWRGSHGVTGRSCFIGESAGG